MTISGEEGDQQRGAGDREEASGKGDELEANMTTHMCQNVIMKLVKFKRTLNYHLIFQMKELCLYIMKNNIFQNRKTIGIVMFYTFWQIFNVSGLVEDSLISYLSVFKHS